MDFIAKSDFSVLKNIFCQEFHEVHNMAKIPHGPLKQNNLSSGKGRFVMRSIFKSWFLGKFEFKVR